MLLNQYYAKIVHEHNIFFLEKQCYFVNLLRYVFV